ncbi:flagellar protein [Sporomusa malonica]|uniref:Flagellar operon protein TIGR03826 n=1 Tax=Sporomusa malonica TaxID=112901 RepID=A0A1W1YU69_9FIRM|nr:flagellar protein [Sporomusa malonica]SMC39760.1 flagellar operon protein TIGR03826 [Sporomusa malonica]
MGLDNCPECGKLYVENAARLCPECYRRQEDDAEKVMEYLRDASKATLEEIHHATGVKHKIILRLLRSGRIVGSSLSYPCDSCGTPIVEGRLCDKCSRNILDQMRIEDRHKEHEPERKTRSRMYGKELDND